MSELNDFQRLCAAFEREHDVPSGVAALLREMREPSEYALNATAALKTHQLAAKAMHQSIIDAILSQASAELREDGIEGQTIISAGE